MADNNKNLQIPKGWRLASLSQIAEIIPSNVDKKIYPNEISVLLCNYMDVYSNDYLTTEINYSQGSVSASEYQKFLLKRGDVIITKDSETPDDIAVPAVVVDNLEKVVCGYHLALLRPKSDVDGVFLSKAIQTHFCRRHFGNSANGATRYGLTYKVIESCQIILPPKNEQIIIAEIILTIDQAIEKTKQLIAKYERIKTGLMQDLLTRGIDEEGNIRNEETHEFKDSPLGKIPKEWHVYKISDLGEWKGGKTPRKSVQKFWMNATHIWYSSKDVVGNILTDSFYKITNDAINETNQSVFPAYESLIFVFRSGILRHTFPISRSNKSFSINQDLKVLVPKKGFSSDFLFQKFKSLERYFLRTAVKVGTTVESVDGHVFFNTELGIPTPKEQEQITKILQTADNKLNLLQSELVKYQKLKTALMQELLTGKVRVDALFQSHV